MSPAAEIYKLTCQYIYKILQLVVLESQHVEYSQYSHSNLWGLAQDLHSHLPLPRIFILLGTNTFLPSYIIMNDVFLILFPDLYFQYQTALSTDWSIIYNQISSCSNPALHYPLQWPAETHLEILTISSHFSPSFCLFSSPGR